MLEDQVAHLLQRYLGNYVRGLSKEALKISVWQGIKSSSSLLFYFFVDILFFAMITLLTDFFKISLWSVFFMFRVCIVCFRVYRFVQPASMLLVFVLCKRNIEWMLVW